MRRRLLLGASISALVTAAAAEGQVLPLGPRPAGSPIGPGGQSIYGPSPLGVPSPTLDLNFLIPGPLDSRITFSRADTTPVASYTDASGVLRYGPVNLVVNSAALPGAGSTAATLTAAATTAPDGTLTAVKMTESATGPTEHYSDVSSLVPAISTTYTFSVYAKAGTKSTAAIELRVGTTWPNSGCVCYVNLATGTITSVSAPGYVTGITAVGNGWYRLSITGTTTAAGTGSSWRLALTDSTPAVSYTGNGTDYIYMWGGQVESGPNMTGFISTGASATSGPRFDYSPATVTNWIRNSTMLGANATGNVFPTFWLHGENTTLTPTIVGVGTETGIPYVDIQISGAATSGNNNIFFDAPAAIQALTGQTWTHSVYLRIVGGSTTNLNQVYVSMQMRDSAGSGLGSFTSNVLASLNGNALAGNRFTLTSALNNASTAFVQPWIQINPQSAAINITLRIGAPQLEQAAAANAFVPTSGTFAGSGGLVRGLLIEEARTNLLFPSGDLSSVWIPSSTTITAAAGTAPDGTIALNRVAEVAATATHFISKNTTIVAATVYTFSLYGRAQQNQYLQLIFDDGSANGVYATFDLVNGTISGAAVARGVGTSIGAVIAPVGNGIYRCSVACATNGTTTGRTAVLLSLTGNPGFAPSYAGNASNGLLVWGAQLEAGAFPTSYIPTTAATVTRAADAATLPIAGWFNASAGAFVAETTNMLTNTGNLRIIGTNSLVAPLQMTPAAQISTYSGVALTGPGAQPYASRVAWGVSYSAAPAGRSICALGGVVTSDANLLGTVTGISLGSAQAGTSNFLNGSMRRVRAWSQTLTAAQLQQVTT